MSTGGIKINMIGRKFGDLLVLKIEGKVGPHIKYICRCKCGSRKSIAGISLRQGATKSCGCRRIASNKRRSTHMMADSPTHIVWMNMRQRCNNPKNRNFKDYGGRSIKVCKRWEKFKFFLEDMGERPPGLTIDRYPNNDGDYEPGNCRWATRKEQANNRGRKCQKK